MSLEEELERALPLETVERTVRQFLDECGWVLEIGEEMISIPKEPAPALVSRAFIVSHPPNVVFGDFEAIFALNPERRENRVVGKAGYLNLYFNRAGEFISEDRFFNISYDVKPRTEE